MLNTRNLTQLLERSKISGALIGLLFFPVLFGCQPRSDKWTPGKGFKTQIIVSKSFGTEFQQVELRGVTDKSTLSGDIADFYFSPSDEGGTLIGNKPIARFIDDDGVFIPADQISLQMVTLYYHLQQLKELELTALHTTNSLLKWPRKVALAVKVKNDPDMRFNNAFYNGKIDALYFVPYRQDAFPIPLNPGIIAHEHFHSYFSYQVLNPLVRKKLLPTEVSVTEENHEEVLNDLYNMYVLKIVNEGLADVWGWVYSRDPDFVVISLPKAEKTRTLDKISTSQNPRLASQEKLKEEIRDLVSCHQRGFRKCLDDAYGHGNRLARSLKSFAMMRQQSTRASDEANRKMMAEKVLNLINEIQKSFVVEKTLNLDQVLSMWEKQFNSITESECMILQNAASSPGVVKCASSAVSSSAP